MVLKIVLPELQYEMFKYISLSYKLFKNRFMSTLNYELKL